MTKTTTKKAEKLVTVQLGKGIDNQYRVLESVQNIARKTQEIFPSFPFTKDMIFSTRKARSFNLNCERINKTAKKGFCRA